eukprot:CAMPEP_0202474226 /NCGR_PEP_ID=MMETSP1360-20130828/92268_1 /ASSEMBLY_ACC=CAM_ASM_000848 /TAXON_ID=515479 /ORGANISM="Licmophora paradoxa, Strain CCMP2313" /LENGTH=46 /DNA_ID= /DNA_START= /DNA_END= /DNA_ORIENTATION=
MFADLELGVYTVEEEELESYINIRDRDNLNENKINMVVTASITEPN